MVSVSYASLSSAPLDDFLFLDAVYKFSYLLIYLLTQRTASLYSNEKHASFCTLLKTAFPQTRLHREP